MRRYRGGTVRHGVWRRTGGVLRQALEVLQRVAFPHKCALISLLSSASGAWPAGGRRVSAAFHLAQTVKRRQVNGSANLRYVLLRLTQELQRVPVSKATLNLPGRRITHQFPQFRHRGSPHIGDLAFPWAGVSLGRLLCSPN